MAVEEPATGGAGDASTTKSQKVKYSWITKLRDFLKERRIELAMWVLRIATVVFVFISIIPFMGNSATYTQRALLTNAATSALRLSQRVPIGSPLSMDFLLRLLIEDSCHYLLYSVLFIMYGNISFSLIPVVLISSLHMASFTLKMLEAAKGPIVRISAFGSFLHVWTFRTNWILKMAAMSELALLGVILFGVFQGMQSIILPILYYRYLTFRYVSRRNPFLRMVMHEMRMNVEKFIVSGTCPGILQKILRMGIDLLCKIAPSTPPPQ